jgi:ElaB/YqjD/DUF883 family membrane-anchored ribosome-binding protein
MSVLKELLEKRDAAHGEIKEISSLVHTESRALMDSEQKRVDELVEVREDLDARIKKENKRIKRDEAIAEARTIVADTEQRSDSDGVKAEVISEPMVYGEGSPYSYFTDLARITAGHQWHFDPAATERMGLWAHQVEREYSNDSQFGKKAEVQLRNQFRTETAVETDRRMKEARDRGRAGQDAKEVRSLATGGGATASAGGGGGAAFVTPVFFVSDYAPYREAGRAFIDQCNKQPLPSYGMTAYMPQVTAKAGVASQTEGSGVNESDPTMGYLTGSLVTKAGQVTVSQQLLDRAGPNFEFDRMLFDQLQRDYNAQVDAYSLTTALATAGSVVYTSGYTLQGLVSKIGGAVNAVETTNGTVMSPTHVFMQPSRWNFAEAAGIDTLNRPLIVPNQSGPYNAWGSGNQSGSVQYEGDTGYKILGLPVFKDLNIPVPTSGADQVVVGNLREVYVYEGPTVTRALPQTLGNNLQVILQLYAYITEIVRYQAAVQTVTGGALSAPVF